MEKGPDPLKALVDRLQAGGAIRSAETARAFLAVPRHAFLPTSARAVAYDDEAVNVKYDGDGHIISSASQPTMMAEMLEQLRPQAGNRVLEIGTGTGYNAALLSELVGESGLVVSVEVDAELAVVARSCLSDTGYGRVEVVVGDGQDGWTIRSPYDCVIVTAGVATVVVAWRDQLRDGGRLVVPLVDDHGVGFATVFEKRAKALIKVAEQPCRFLALRSATPDPQPTREEIR
ncbi:MAG: methyltransferase domain-containing protein [Actinomycetota bacterium]|nr:methyltransferase domain-containing protein [Actinomycetota bacterium]